MEIEPATDTLRALGNTVRLTATAMDNRGHVVTGTFFSWNSSDPAVVSVDSTGLVMALAPGAADITATTGGASGFATVAVVQVPASLGVAAGDQQTGGAGRSLPVKVSVVVRDSGGSGAPGVPVVFTVTESPGVIGYVAGCWGKVTPDTQTTDAKGIAAVDWRLGFYPGRNVLQAVVSGLPAVAFTAAGIPADSSRLLVSASRNTLAVTERIWLEAEAWVVSCAEGSAFWLPVGARWTSSNPSVATVDSSSGAVTGTGPGTVQITATSGPHRGTISLTVVQRTGTVRMVSGSGQTGTCGQPLKDSLVVQAIDTLGLGIAGIPIYWTEYYWDGVPPGFWWGFAHDTTRADGTTAAYWVPMVSYPTTHTYTLRAETPASTIAPRSVTFTATLVCPALAPAGAARQRSPE